MHITKLHTSVLALFLAVIVSLGVGFLSGCSSNQTIGTQSNDAVKIAVKNATGQSITEVSAKSSLQQDFSDHLDQTGDWKNDSTIDLYLDQAFIEVSDESITEGEASTVTEVDEIVIEPRTDLQFTTADGMTYTLHQLNIEDIKDASLRIEDGTAFLIYTSISTGEEVNTLESELDYLEQVKAAEEEAKAAEEKAKAEAEAKAAAEKAAAEANAKKQASNSSSTSKSSSSKSSSSASSGEDACVDDLILN